MATISCRIEEGIYLILFIDHHTESQLVMKTITKFLFAIAMLGGVFAYADTPDAESVTRVQSLISRIADDLDSDQFDNALKDELSGIVASYGVEGLGAVAVEEPILFEVMLLSPDFGLEVVVDALFPQAQTADELQSRLNQLSIAQVAVGADARSTEALELIAAGIARSSVSLEASELEAALDLAMVAALEVKNDEVKAASYYGNRLDGLLRLRARLVRIFGEFSFIVELIDRVISRVQNN